MADITYTIEAIDKTTSVMRNISSAITGLNQGLQLANQVYQTAQKVISATVGEYVKYANQVRTITQVTGQSAEAVSRMIQVADDYKISTEQLTLAMKKLAGEGAALTTESLAALSDEYLKLSAGVERQTFLTEKFGRQGTAFAEIMLEGGDAIRAQSAAINQNLILNKQALANAREYERANDALNDTITGLKNTVSMQWTPALTNTIKAMDVIIRAVTEANHAFEALGYSLSGLPEEAQAAWGEFFRSVGNKIEDINFIFGDIADSSEQAAQGMDDAAESALDFSTQLSSITTYAEAYDQSTRDIAAAEKELADLRAAGWGEHSEKIKDVKTRLADLQAAQDKQTAQWMVNVLTQQMGMDGISQAEMDFLLQYQVDTGLIEQDSADRAKAAWEEAMQLNEAYGSVQGQYYIDFYLQTHGSTPAGVGGGGGSGTGQVTARPAANGGYLRGWTEVGEQGTEGVTPWGYVIPHNQWEQMKRSGVVAGNRRAAGGYIPGAGGTGYDPSAVPDTAINFDQPVAYDWSAFTWLLANNPTAVSTLSPEYSASIQGSASASGSNQALKTSGTTATIAAVKAATNATVSVSKAADTISQSGEETTKSTQAAAAQARTDAQQQNELLAALLVKTASKDDIMSAFNTALQQNF